jgi:hypothetical protein
VLGLIALVTVVITAIYILLFHKKSSVKRSSGSAKKRGRTDTRLHT